MSAIEWVASIALVVGGLSLLALVAAAAGWWVSMIRDAYGFVEKALTVAFGLFIASLVTLFITSVVFKVTQ